MLAIKNRDAKTIIPHPFMYHKQQSAYNPNFVVKEAQRRNSDVYKKYKKKLNSGNFDGLAIF